MSRKKQSDVKTTKDSVSIFTCTIALESNTRGVILASTDQAMVTGSGGTRHQETFLTGTAVGAYKVVLHPDNVYNQCLGYHVVLAGPRADRVHAYQVTPFSGSGEGIQFYISSGSGGTPQLVAPTTAMALTASVYQTMRNTNRTT